MVRPFIVEMLFLVAVQYIVRTRDGLVRDAFYDDNNRSQFCYYCVQGNHQSAKSMADINLEKSTVPGGLSGENLSRKRAK